MYTPRQLSLIAGVSYLVIFFAAIYANFFVLESLLANPEGFVAESALQVRLGAMAFLVAAVFDVIVAWALFELYKTHQLSSISTYFRVMHAAIMGLAVYALLGTLGYESADMILAQVQTFNTLWLIGLFFFGVHLILLTQIMCRRLRFIPWVLGVAGVMYMVDTAAQFTWWNYTQYADTFLLLVAVPAVLGEMSLAIWLLLKGDSIDEN